MASLRQRAIKWCDAASPMLSVCQVDDSNYHDLRVACVMHKKGKPVVDKFGVRPTGGICTKVLGPQFYANAFQEGIVVLELFGGLCAGLEMVLRNGIKVHNYLYCDKDVGVRRIAAHRMHQLSEQYPALLSPRAFSQASTALPQDVWRVGSEQLVHAGVLNGQQWLVVAGFECQDLSPAGKGKGINGEHSRTFYALRNILGAMQQLQVHRPPAYLIENTYLNFDFGKVQRTSSHSIEVICNGIGSPVSCDAAAFDSYAHRLRHYWTNLAFSEHLHTVLKSVVRTHGLLVSDILLPNRMTFPVDRSDRKPFYECNVKGEPRSAFPTFLWLSLSHVVFSRVLLVLCMIVGYSVGQNLVLMNGK